MTADTGNDTEATKKRGRIPQSAWPHIVDRYRSGATLSAIAREFDCTPSAISYIIRKAEAAGIEPSGNAEEGDSDVSQDVEAGADAGTTSADSPALTAASDTARAAAPESMTPPVPATAPPVPAPSTAAPATRATAPANPPQQQTLRLNPPAPPPEPEPEAPAPITTRPPAPAVPASGAAASGKPEPTPPVDAVEARLRETARGCLSAYRAWRQAPGEGNIQTLSDAVHELRKALARVEIDMSASRREEQAIRPIPIPVHRSSRRPQ